MGNSAPLEGGGSCSGTLNNCTVVLNSTGDEGGGARGGTLNNCTLSANFAGLVGGGSSRATLNNCISYFNTTGFSSDFAFRNNYLSSIRYSCTDPIAGAIDSIDQDPLFVDFTNKNFRLKAASPCINRGNNTYAPGAADRDGNPRIVKDTVDMGAYEFQGYWAWAAAIGNGLTNFDQSATGDGYPNLLKYATGSSPTTPDDLAHLTMMRISNEIFAVGFHRNTNAIDVSILVEGANSATNGATWIGIATNVSGSWGGSTNIVESGTGTPLVVSVRDRTPEGGTPTNRYLRLRVTQP
jgi:hypothetical protein